MAEHLRTKKLSDSGLQLRLVAVFTLLSCVAALFQVLLTNRAIMRLSQRMETDGDAIMAELPGILIHNLGWTLGILLPLMLVIGILVTHRIAGPVYRFERHLDAVARGENPGPCKIRKEDELHQLCEKINAAVLAMQKRSEEAEPAERPSVAA